MKRIVLILLVCFPVCLCSCVTKSSNDAYESSLNARENALKAEYERHYRIQNQIAQMERDHEEMSKPITGSAAGDAALGLGISVFIGSLLDALVGN